MSEKIGMADRGPMNFPQQTDEFSPTVRSFFPK